MDFKWVEMSRFTVKKGLKQNFSSLKWGQTSPLIPIFSMTRKRELAMGLAPTLQGQSILSLAGGQTIRNYIFRVWPEAKLYWVLIAGGQTILNLAGGQTILSLGAATFNAVLSLSGGKSHICVNTPFFCMTKSFAMFYDNFCGKKNTKKPKKHFFDHDRYSTLLLLLFLLQCTTTAASSNYPSQL